MENSTYRLRALRAGIVAHSVCRATPEPPDGSLRGWERWEGEYCEVASNACASNPCFHGAICIDKQFDFYCICPLLSDHVLSVDGPKKLQLFRKTVAQSAHLGSPISPPHVFSPISLVVPEYNPVFIPRSAGFDPDAALHAVHNERCTALYGTPTMFVDILNSPVLPSVDLMSLETGAMAGSPCPAPLVRQVIDKLHMRDFCIVFGMTETSPATFATYPMDDVETRATTVGCLLPHTEAMVVDAKERGVKLNEVGELWIRGYCNFLGYWGEEEKTQEILTPNGWLKTGDMVQMDKNGNINCNRAVITMVRRAAFKRLYPIMFIQPDGSTFTARYEIPRAIIKLPVNPNVLTAAELERHREQLRPRKKMAQEDMLDDVGFKRDRYSHLWRQRAAGNGIIMSRGSNSVCEDPLGLRVKKEPGVAEHVTNGEPMENEDEGVQRKKPRRKATVQDDDEDEVEADDCLEDDLEEWDDSSPIVAQARVKPKERMLELKVRLDTYSSNYDKGRGEQIAVNADGVQGSRSEAATFPEGRMGHQTLHSSLAVRDTKGHALGMFRDGALYLSPFHTVLHMRPGFEYMDKAETRRKAVDEEMQGDSQPEEMSEAAVQEESGPKLISVKFSRTENERTKRARERSFNALEARRREEPWMDVAYRPQNSQEAEEARNLMSQVDKAPQQMLPPLSSFDASAYDYLVGLCPVDSESREDESGKKPVGVAGTEGDLKSASPSTSTPSSSTKSSVVGVRKSMASLSLKEMRSLSLAQQVEAVLLKTHIVSLSRLSGVLHSSSFPQVDTISVLKALQKSGMLIQGNWSPLSEVLFPPESPAVLSIPSATICKARDRLLHLFTESRVISRSAAQQAARITPDGVSYLLSHVAVCRGPKEGWELRVPTDYGFITRYREIVDRQRMLWDARLVAASQTPPLLPTAPSVSFLSTKSPRRRSRSRKDSVGSTTSEGKGEKDIGGAVSPLLPSRIKKETD
ncbi:unnamed protein product [Cyprideis torosa]|uniref:Uncharacterized protein n=1 Tax=Cyprideis torosa TaxID=163714 RepID=A0A7R8W7X4_9CRUS|nr:unnamed protein product [Cyprideis torosa]CAG0886847.1 unnamed protein product [Cyprideis torosa]